MVPCQRRFDMMLCPAGTPRTRSHRLELADSDRIGQRPWHHGRATVRSARERPRAERPPAGAKALGDRSPHRARLTSPEPRRDLGSPSVSGSGSVAGSGNAPKSGPSCPFAPARPSRGLRVEPPRPRHRRGQPRLPRLGERRRCPAARPGLGNALPVRHPSGRHPPVRHAPVRQFPIRQFPIRQFPIRQCPIRRSPVRRGAATVAVRSWPGSGVVELAARLAHSRVCPADSGDGGLVPKGRPRHVVGKARAPSPCRPRGRLLDASHRSTGGSGGEARRHRRRARFASLVGSRHPHPGRFRRADRLRWSAVAIRWHPARRGRFGCPR